MAKLELKIEDLKTGETLTHTIEGDLEGVAIIARGTEAGNMYMRGWKLTLDDGRNSGSNHHVNAAAELEETFEELGV